MYKILFLLIFFVSFNFKTYGALIKNIPIGMKSIGMNESSSALSERTEALNINPGGLGKLKKKEVSYFHTSYINNISIENISYVTPLYPSMVKRENNSLMQKLRIGINLGYLYYKDINVYDSFGAVEQTVDYNILSLKLGMGVPLSEGNSFRLYIGVAEKMDKETIDDFKVSSFSTEMGAMAVFVINKASGLYSLLGPQFRISGMYNKEEYSIGFGFKFLKRIFVGYDIKNRDGIVTSYLGGEIWLWKHIGIRAGWSDSSNFAKIGYGLSVALKKEKNKRLYVEFNSTAESEIDTVYNIGVKYVFK